MAQIKEPTKARILKEALRLIADRGYEATTMNEIAASVGIKAASLYAHYKSKEELFLKVLESALEDWEGLVDGVFSRAELCGGMEDGLDLILGDFACAMTGSVEYRFWTRVYVFPPKVLSRKYRKRMVELDRAFAERLGRFCGSRAPAGAPKEELAELASSLSYFTMGLMTYAETMSENSLRGEIRRGVAFHMKAIKASGRGAR